MSSVVNISELYNVVTSASGVGADNASLQADIQNLQKMVQFDTKTILANTIARYDASPIVVRDTMSFLNSIQVAGTVTQNGTTLTSAKPVGATTEIQFNNGGIFAASPKLAFDGTSLVNPSLRAPSATLQTQTSTSASLLIDTAIANNVNIRLATATTSLSFTGAPLTGLYRLLLIIKQDDAGGRTVTWPSSVLWGIAGPPLLSATPLKTDIIELITPDAGLNWFAHTIGLGF